MEATGLNRCGAHETDWTNGHAFGVFVSPASAPHGVVIGVSLVGYRRTFCSPAFRRARAQPPLAGSAPLSFGTRDSRGVPLSLPWRCIRGIGSATAQRAGV